MTPSTAAGTATRSSAAGGPSSTGSRATNSAPFRGTAAATTQLPATGGRATSTLPDWTFLAGRPMSDRRCRSCGHPEDHHDAGECWTDDQGREVYDGPHCPCSWAEFDEETTAATGSKDGES